MCDLSNPVFHSETKARRYLEKQRWADGVYCPWCGQFDSVKPVPASSMKNKKGEPQEGWHHCNSCRRKFTVRVGTLFERSHVPLHKWLMAFHLLTSSKKGMSSHQLHRMLGVTYKTAWFMSHRIREAFKPGDGEGPLGGSDKHVEADETYFGTPSKKYRTRFRNEYGWYRDRETNPDKSKIVTLVERGGKARSFKVETVTTWELQQFIFTNVDRKSTLQTDESVVYKPIGKQFAKHEKVNHSKDEYVRGTASSNTIEGYFSIFKRGMRGVYQHCGEQHLHRYLAEFDFRYNHRTALGFNDNERALAALKGIEGKRLTYRRTREATYA